MLDRRVMSNEDIAARVHAASGNVTHVDMVPSRAGPWRPPVASAATAPG